LYWDEGVPANGYKVLSSGITTQTFLASNLNAGTTYSFQVASRNIFGLSLVSNTVTILSAFKPAQPIAPVTTIKNNTVEVTWLAPSANGSPLTSYTVKFSTSTGSFLTELASCDGSNSVVFNAAKCTIPLNTLTSAPFNLVLGAGI
jgi:hypothetical protein